VGDIQNCEWTISAEGERYINDDNANPPVCYNHGSCQAISSDAQSGADGALRPRNTGQGLITYDSTTFIVTSTPVRCAMHLAAAHSADRERFRLQDIANGNATSAFKTTLSAGMIVRALSPNASGDLSESSYLDLRVAQARG
jgi:hypothetical protein